MNPFPAHGATRSSQQHRRSASSGTCILPSDSKLHPTVPSPFSGFGNPPTLSSGNINVTPTQHSFSLDTHTASTVISNSQSTSLDDIVIKPAKAAVTSRPFPKSIPLSVDEESFTSTPKKSHQRSFSALLPFGNTRSSLQSTPTSPPQRDTSSYFMPFTGDKDQKRIQRSTTAATTTTSSATGGWFSGTSAPIPLGISHEDDEMATSEDNTSTHRRKASIASINNLPPASTATSRFGFFSKPSTATRTVQLPATDPFLNLDIQAALFPSGVPSDRDPFSPSAFKNLLTNAEGLLTALQSAYLERTASLSELKAEYDAQNEEREEAETRAACLKQQLEDMAKRVEAQDEAMVKLVQEMAEQKASQREREASACVVVRGPTPVAESVADSCPDEDLDIRRASAMSDVSSAFDSDGEESIFSRARSPTNISDMAPPPVPPKDEEIRKPSVVGRVFGIGGNTRAEMKAECRNCRNGDARFAWDAVKTLRVENKGLKERVVVLEGAVESVLDLVR